MFRVCKDLCIGCGVCVDICPEEAIVMTEDEVAEINIDKCASCGICFETCVQEAIEEIEEGEKD